MQIFLDKWSPQYVIPLAITCAIEGLALLLVILLRGYMTIENRRRNKAQNVNWQSKDVPTEALIEGPKNPTFRYFH